MCSLNVLILFLVQGNSKEIKNILVHKLYRFLPHP